MRAVVYTRRIVDPALGLKLTGKAGGRTTLSALYARDELEAGDPAGERAHFPILRLKHALSGDSYLGGVYTGRETDDGYNRLGGLDGELRLGAATLLDLSGLAAATRRPGEDAAATGHALAAGMQRDTRDLTLALGAREISTEFDTQVGYLTRTGIRQFSVLVRPKLYPAGDFVQRLDLEAFSAQGQDLPSGRWETFNHVSGQIFCGGTATLKLKYSSATEIFAGRRFDTGGFHAYAANSFGNKLYAGVLYRRIGAVNYDPAAPFQGWSNRWTAEVSFQPSEQLTLGLSYLRFDFHDEADDRELYEYPIRRAQLTYQPHRTLFLRGIVESNDFRDEVLTDLLASFTTIPGTVLYLGYGSLQGRQEWDPLAAGLVPTADNHELKRSVFLKASYLWRL